MRVRRIIVYLDPSSLPNCLWTAIFLRCDSDTLTAVSMTCKHFYGLLKNNDFWIDKCVFDDVPLPPMAWRQLAFHERGKSFDFRLIYEMDPFDRNLVDYKITKRSTINQLKRHPNLSFTGSSTMAIEFHNHRPTGPSFVREGPLGPVEACLVTRHDWGSKLYTVDLVEAGIEPWVMDEIRPIITVRELAMCRHDCAAIFDFHAQLLKENETFHIYAQLPRFKRIMKSWEQWESGVNWEVFEHVFENYPSGMRKLSVLSRGRDLQYWEDGHYGAKFANLEIVVTFPEEVRLKTLEEFPEQIKLFLPDRIRYVYVTVGNVIAHPRPGVYPPLASVWSNHTSS